MRPEHDTSLTWSSSILSQRMTFQAHGPVPDPSRPRFYTSRTMITTWISLRILQTSPFFWSFCHDEEIWFLTSVMMNQRPTTKLTTKGNSVSSIMLIGLSVKHTRRRNVKDYTHRTSTMFSIWWGTSKYSRLQAPTWSSP